MRHYKKAKKMKIYFEFVNMKAKHTSFCSHLKRGKSDFLVF